MSLDKPSPRVLVIRGGAIGDFILTLPTLRLLRESIPGVHLEVLGCRPIVTLALTAGLADAVHHLEHVKMAKLFVPDALLDEELSSWLTSFNLIVSYLYDPDDIVKGNMERLRVRTFLQGPSQVLPGQGHAAVQLARPLERLAFFLEDAAPRILPSTSAGQASTSPVLALHPGSGSLRKNWPTEHWAALGRSIAADFPHARLALVTGEAEWERGITAQIIQAWQGIEFLHWNMLPLEELAHRLSGITAFLGHDSGISHLAAACGAPCLLFFGPTDPETWAPRNAGVRVWRERTGDLATLSVEAGWHQAAAFLREVLPR